MARSMRLFLIRHGETVDNVAQLYAGSRDSELTNHGFQQATRLGLHFQAIGISFSHLFSSHLQRAAKTAGKIREAQLARVGGGDFERLAPDVVQLPILMEQDFGTMEGKKWYDRPLESKVSEGIEHTTRFVDVESKESMAQRADKFLNEHLLPLLHDPTCFDPVVAIVSHGIFVSKFWKRLLLRLPPLSVKLSAELQATARPSLEHLGGWSNTGYLEVHMTKDTTDAHQAPRLPSPKAETLTTRESDGRAEIPVVDASLDDVDEQSFTKSLPPSNTMQLQPAKRRFTHGWRITILTINGKDHLKGLKRTGGGVGSSRHDAKQKSIESFFKRRKVDQTK